MPDRLVTTRVVQHYIGWYGRWIEVPEWVQKLYERVLPSYVTRTRYTRS